MTYPTSCICCQKLTTSKGIFSHFLHSHGNEEQIKNMKKGTIALNNYARNNNKIKNKKVLEKNIENYLKNSSLCKNCNVQLPYDKKQNKFCSRSCNASFNNKNRNYAVYEKQRLTLFKTLGIDPKPIKIKKVKSTQRNYFRADGPYTKIYGNYCACCSNWFWANTLRKTCSPECQRKNSTYRKIVIEYLHNNEILKLESSWELEIAKWLDTHQIQWVRPKHIIWFDSNGKLRRYFPDFYLTKYNVYLDPKNSYQIKISQEKLNAISKNNTLFYGEVDFIKSQVENLISK
jgi:hypothetical protein